MHSFSKFIHHKTHTTIRVDSKQYTQKVFYNNQKTGLIMIDETQITIQDFELNLHGSDRLPLSNLKVKKSPAKRDLKHPIP